MRYNIAPLYCRPWTLNGITPQLIESHYENGYGSALNRLNSITEELEALDPTTTPAHVLSRLKRDEATALNSTLLHELYFASLGGDGRSCRMKWPTRSRATSALCRAGARNSSH
jgi:superoxide dismutase, Fe-Mn family